jgi:quercetin dioxygenase-like cupin family protein
MRVHRAKEIVSHPITAFESHGASVTHLARGDNVSVVRIELEAGGRLGMHPAASPQPAGHGLVRCARVRNGVE